MKLPKQIKHWLDKNGLSYHKRCKNCYKFSGKGLTWWFSEVDEKVYLSARETYDASSRDYYSYEYTTPFDCKNHKEFQKLIYHIMENVK